MTQPSARAETLLQHARVEYARGNHDACRQDVDEALGLVRGSGLPVETALLVQEAQLTIWTSDPESTRTAALSALAAARQSESFLADAQLVAAQALYVGHDEACIEHFAAAAAAAQAAGNDEIELDARLFHAGSLQAFCRADEALAATAALEREALARHKKLWVQLARWHQARVRWLAHGDLTTALPLIRALAASRALGLHRPQVLAEYALMLADAGETDDAHAMIVRARQAADTRWTTAITAFYRAEIEWSAGRAARALEGAAETLAAGPPAPQELVARSTRLWALFELGRPEQDAQIESVPAMPLLAGAVVENRAFAAVVDGDLERAEGLLGEAAALWHGRVVRAELRALWGTGELAQRLGDTARASEILQAVEERTKRLGLVSLLARARRSLDRISTRGARAPRKARISPREHEVLQLVGRGLRSREIAAALGLSRRTVDAHVRAAMQKLGAATRVEAAASARRMDDLAPPPILLDDDVALLRLLADGSTVAGAASLLGVSRRTATRRLRALRERIGVRTNAEAALLVRPGA